MSAKEEILARVRAALVDVPAGVPIEEDSPVDWAYQQPVEVGDILDVFVERVIDYKATVVRTPAAKVNDEITRAIKELGVKTAVVPVGLDEEWKKAIKAGGAEVNVDDKGHRLTSAELNEIDAVVTASRVGSAETGTIMLDHSDDQGRRALSLVPDVHICVIRADQVVSSVPEAVARLKPSVLNGQPLTWISGPSATSDIELSRVEGVHGPRTLYVIFAE